MKESVTFLDCPAFIDADDGLRWGLPAHVQCRCVMNSTGRPVDGAVTNCPAGHHSSGPIEFLTFKVYPGSGDAPGWRLGSDGFCIVLTAGLTSVIGRWLGGTVTSFLAEVDLTVEEISARVCHPGGPKVVHAIQNSLKLPDSASAVVPAGRGSIGQARSRAPPADAGRGHQRRRSPQQCRPAPAPAPWHVPNRE